MRILAAATSLSTALLLSLGAVVAHADPTFVLSSQEAKGGEKVLFSIGGTEEGAEYSLEIGDRVVAEGSDPAGNGISRGFIMPNLGDTSSTVTVEAQITQSEETTTLTSSLRYLAPSPALSDPAGTQQTPIPIPSALQPDPTSTPTPRSLGRRRSSRRRAERRRARHPPRTRERSSGRRRSSGGGERRRPGAPVSIRRGAGLRKHERRTKRRVGSGETWRSSGPIPSGNRPSGSKKGDAAGDGPGAPSRPSALFTRPPSAPAIFSPGSAAVGGSAGIPIAAVIVPGLLGLAALALAGGLLPRNRRAAYVDDFDDEDGGEEILRGTVHVLRSRSALESDSTFSE